MFKSIKVLFLFLISLMVFLGCNGRINESMGYKSVKITFTGLKGEFYNKRVYYFNITDKDVVNDLNLLKNGSRRDYFSSSRPVMYEIELLYTSADDEDDLLLTIITTTDNKTLIRVGYYAQYVNQDLFNYIASLIELEEIKKGNY